MLDWVRQFKVHPVLLDVRASDHPPKIWQPIASQAIYIGFDPDLREMRAIQGGTYDQTFILNEAVTPNPQATIQFFLTHSPQCSSTLQPDPQVTENYLYNHLFTVERTATAPAITLDAALDRLELPCVHWLKTDSQGTDLRLFQSLSPQRQQAVLALEIEPGLMPVYQGEDTFTQAQLVLLAQGFWLSHLEIKGTIRGQADILNQTLDYTPINYRLYDGALKRSPIWCEARYLRTHQFLADRNAPREDYQLLWLFALLDNQIVYALEILSAVEKHFGKDDLSQTMKNHTLDLLQTAIRTYQEQQKPPSLGKRIYRRFKRILP